MSPLIAHLSIKQRLFLVFLILAAALGSFGVYLYTRLNVINQSYAAIDQRYSRLGKVLALEIDSKKLSNTVKSYLLTQDPKWQTQYDHTSSDLDAAFKALDSTSSNAKGSETLEQYETVTGKLKGTELLILAEIKEGRLERARSLFDLAYENQQAQATGYITDLVGVESASVKTVITENRRQVASIQTSLVLTLVVIMVLALLFFFVFASSIIGPIQALTAAALKFAKGDFSVRVDIKSEDELGRLSSVFNDMVLQLQQTYAKLNQTLHEVVQRTDQLGEEKARFSSSIDSLPLGFIMTSASNSILRMNPAMHFMLGFKNKPGDLAEVDQRLKDNASLLEQLMEHSHDCLTQKKPISISEVGDKGKIFRAFFSPVLIDNNADSPAIGAAILVEDVTEERVMARSKDEFFSIASHELRTPLTAIRGNTSMIQTYYNSQLKDPSLRGMVGDIHESSVRLIEIVNDFLDASRLEQGKMQFDPEEFSIEETIEKIVYELGGVTKEKHLYLRMTNDLGTLPHVWADKNKIKQVVYNLVGNALKFVETGGVTIQAVVENKYIKINVIDTGRGISEENQQLLFHKFQQASKSIITRDTTRGTGLGLYISKLLLEQMDGKITLEHSAIGKGSTFSFTIPIFEHQAPKSKTKD